MRAQVAGAADPRTVERNHRVAAGATAGNIIAAIIGTQEARNGSGPTPPMAIPEPSTWRRTSSHAAAAIPARASQTPTVRSPLDVASRGTAAWAEEANAGSAFIGKLRDERVATGEAGLPRAAVGHLGRLPLSHRLGHGHEGRVG